MGTLLQDLKYGTRVLLKSPGFTAVAILVLTLGIGANTAIFSVVNAVLLRPLPYRDFSHLVQVWHVPPPKSFPGVTRFAVSAANYLDWNNQNHVFDQLAIYTYANLNFSGKGQPESVTSGVVSPNFFAALQVRPLLGRTFLPDEDLPGHANVAVLGHALWRDRFGSDPAIVGQNVTLNGQGYLVAGVMPSSFQLPPQVQMWTPLAMTDKEKAVRGEHHFGVIGRLKPGVDVKQAQAEMNTISSQLEQQYPADDKGWGAVVIPLREQLVGSVRPALLVLLGAVAFVLLIACANVANLVLAKTLGRRKEIAIRGALGASRARVLQQVLSETVLLAVAGGVLGLVVAHFGVRLISAVLAGQLSLTPEINLDGFVLGFTLGISLLTGVLAGLVPAMRLTKTDLNEALKQGLGRTDADSGGKRTRAVLVVAEVALSLMLLIGAGLMIRSLWLLRNVDPGLDPSHVLTMTVGIPVPSTRFPTPQDQSNFFREVLQRVRTLPGVESAGVIDALPLTGGGSTQPIAIEDRPPAAMADQPEVAVRLVSPGYLHAMRIPLLRGRDLTEADAQDRPHTILISQSMASRFWPNQDPIGKHITLTFFPDAPREIVGIVGDVKDNGLDFAEPITMLYTPLAQLSAPALGVWSSFPMSLVIRTNTEPASLASAVSAAVHQVDSELPLLQILTMQQVIDASLSQQRFNMFLLTVFAGLALLLAAVGIYSVLSYSVRRRIREIGIRMALGAQLRDILGMVLMDGMTPTLIGLGLGLAGALMLGRVVSSLIFGVTAKDPLTFGAVSILLAAVAFLASVIPAYRATRVEPMKALRDE
ncbi:MAG: ABC transporter permease [Terriglobales bacterium]